MQTQSGAKDFFMHVAVVVLLYAGTVALLNVLFRAINVAFPKITNAYQYYNPSISLPVAVLIVVFPLFLFMANLLQKSYLANPEKKEYAVRKWLIYLTLFLAGGVLAGDLVTLIYYFIDGQELTAAFLLKILAVLVVVGVIFGYYLDDLKGRLSGSRRMIWRILAIVLVVGSIAVGFYVLGTPAHQRALRYDSQRVSDLQGIQWQLVSFWQNKEALPASLSDLSDPISGYMIPNDPETGEPYTYERTGALSFKLCANFSASSDQAYSMAPESVAYPAGSKGENWNHASGLQCFDRAIDPDIYKPITR